MFNKFFLNNFFLTKFFFKWIYILNLFFIPNHHSGYVPPGPPDPKKSSHGWIIAVSVIGGLLVLGGIGFYIWKKKKE